MGRPTNRNRKNWRTHSFTQPFPSARALPKSNLLLKRPPPMHRGGSFPAYRGMEEARGPSQVQHRGIRKHRDPEDAGDLAQIGHDRSQENWRPGRGWRLPRVHPRESPKTQRHRGDQRSTTGVVWSMTGGKEQPKALQRTEGRRERSYQPPHHSQSWVTQVL